MRSIFRRMSSQTCPACKSPLPQRSWLARFALSHCEECGWKQRAFDQSWLRQLVVTVPGIFLLAIIGGRDSWRFILGVALLSAGMHLVGVWRARKNVEPVPSILPREIDFPARFEQKPWTEVRPDSPRCPPEYEYIFALPRPRELRATWRSVLQFGLALPIIGLALWLFIRDIHIIFPPGWMTRINKNSFFFAIVTVLVVADGLSFLVKHRPKVRELLSEGEVSLGWVTNVTETSGDQRRMSIEYEFLDLTGRFRFGRCEDLTLASCEGEVVPVFYEASKPTNNVALCGSRWEIAGLDGKVPKLRKPKTKDGDLRLSL